MTETPRDPAGEPTSGSVPPPPPPPGHEAPAAGGYQAEPAGYPPPPAGGYEAPPAGGYAAPPAGGYEAPPAGGYEAPPGGGYGAATGYQAGNVPPPAGMQPPPATYQEQPPATPGGFQAAAAGFGQQFSDYDAAGTMKNFDARSVNGLDWGIIAAGVIALIFSTFSFYKYTVSFSGLGLGSGSATISAWHGFFGWFGVLVALLASLLLAADLIAKIRFPFATRLVVLGGYVVALLCELLALFIVPGNTGSLDPRIGIKIDKGHGFAYWIVLIVVIAGTALAVKRFSDTGGKLPKRG